MLGVFFFTQIVSYWPFKPGEESSWVQRIYVKKNRIPALALDLFKLIMSYINVTGKDCKF